VKNHWRGWVPWFMSVNLATWEAEIRKIEVCGQPRQITLETPISKITRAKWTGSMDQEVECLLCKGKALGSNPSPTKQRKKKKKTLEGLETWFKC
jgi:hypothetical protein